MRDIPRMTLRPRKMLVTCVAHIRRMDFSDTMIGVIIGISIAGGFFSYIQVVNMNDSEARFKAQIEIEHTKIIEAAQLQVSDALAKADAFRNSLFCAAETVVCGCERWEPKVKGC